MYCDNHRVLDLAVHLSRHRCCGELEAIARRESCPWPCRPWQTRARHLQASALIDCIAQHNDAQALRLLCCRKNGKHLGVAFRTSRRCRSFPRSASTGKRGSFRTIFTEALIAALALLRKFGKHMHGPTAKPASQLQLIPTHSKSEPRGGCVVAAQPLNIAVPLARGRAPTLCSPWPRSKNEEVELNFGNGAAPFVFDLDQLVRADQDVQGRAVHGCAAQSLCLLDSRGPGLGLRSSFALVLTCDGETTEGLLAQLGRGFVSYVGDWLARDEFLQVI